MAATGLFYAPWAMSRRLKRKIAGIFLLSFLPFQRKLNSREALMKEALIQ